jgi:hypothetical protein
MKERIMLTRVVYIDVFLNENIMDAQGLRFYQ